MINDKIMLFYYKSAKFPGNTMFSTFRPTCMRVLRFRKI